MRHTLWKPLSILLAIATLAALLSAGASAAEQVRVGFFPLNHFFEEDANGNLTGYGVDYTGRIAAQAGWDVAYVRYGSWDETVDGLRRGEVDIIAPSQRTEERAEEFAFDSFPIGTEYGALMALTTNSSLTYEDFDALDGMTVGCVPSIVFMDSFLQYMELSGFDVNFAYYKDTAALLAALNAGEVDVVLANLMAKTGIMKVLAKFGPAPFYYMLRKDSPALLAELNSAISQYSSQYPSTLQDLASKYFGYFSQTPFTQSELDYIRQLAPIKVGCRSNFAPLSYLDPATEELAGIDIDVLKRMSELMGVAFEYIPLPTDSVSYDFLRDNHILLVTDVEYTTVNANASGVRLTDPYIAVSEIFVGHRDRVYELAAPLTVAVASASEYMESVIYGLYPNFTVKRYANASECLDAVRAGDADLTLENRFVIEPLMAKPRYDTLAILPVNALSGQLCMGLLVNQSTVGVADEALMDQRLMSALNKALAHISDAEMEQITSTHAVYNQYQFTAADFLYQYRYPLAALLVALLLLAALAAYTLRVRRKGARMIAENEKKLRSITNNINGGVVVVRANQGLEIIYANDGFLKLIECTRAEFEKLYQNSYLTYVHPDDLAQLNGLLSSTAIDQKTSVALRLRRKDGTFLNALFTGTVTLSPGGEREVYCVIMDMTQQARLTEQLQFENARANLILKKSTNVVYELHIGTGTLTVSNSQLEKLGWDVPPSIDRLTSGNLARIWHILPEDVFTLDQTLQEVLDTRQDAQCQIRLSKADGTVIWCDFGLFPVLSGKGEIVSLVGQITDVDAQVRRRLELEEQSMQDPLTRLYNKEAFKQLASEHLRRHLDRSSTLIFIDLDHFKAVNDRLGHMIGDQAICTAARKLQVAFSNYDLVARFGGDEFCILAKDIPLPTLEDKLNWLLEKQREDYTDGETTVHVTCSIGVARTDTVGSNFQHLLLCADKALYASKERGRNRYTIYSDELA